ncbi:MAG TPA: hypothetical protein DD640_06785 [Clostridiales bacterium]|nr:hypothetical protein [Clostridiales bacterium]
MNSFERFNTTLDHKKPDRMPLYIPAVVCSVASEILGYGAYTGGDSLHFREESSWLLGEQAHEEFVSKYIEDTLALAKELGVDVIREAWRNGRRPTRKIDDNTLLFGDENGRYTVKRFFPEPQSYGTVRSTEGYRDVDELIITLKNSLNHQTCLTDDELTERYKDQLTLKNKAGNGYAMIAGGLSLGFSIGEVAWLEAIALEPELLRDYYLKMAEDKAKQVGWFKKHGFRFINAGSDIASQTGPIISPQAFSFIFEPALKILADECNRLDMIYCYRSDGNMWGLCDSIFKNAKVQAYGEVDRHASMTVGCVREKYPETIILGNIGSITLNNGTPQQVRDETRDTLVESGGYNYIAGPSNAIVHGTPVENVYAMADEIRNFKP